MPSLDDTLAALMAQPRTTMRLGTSTASPSAVSVAGGTVSVDRWINAPSGAGEPVVLFMQDGAVVASVASADSGSAMVAAVALSTSIPSSALTTTNFNGWTISIESGGWAVSGDGSQLVVPVSGWYQCSGRSAYSSSGNGTVRALLISPNGQVSVASGAIGNTMTSPSTNTSGLGFMIAVSGVIQLNAGDTLGLRGRQDSGATLSPNGYLQAALVQRT